MREGTYRKTEAGRDEIRDRSRRLAPAVRTVLLMVDGQRSLPELKDVVTGVKAPDDALEQLAALGLIEPTVPVEKGFNAAGLVHAMGPSGGSRAAPAAPAEAAGEPAAVVVADGDRDQYLQLYGQMSEAVRAHLGLRGYFLQLKIERCTDAAGLLEVLPELRQALAKSKGEAFAASWEQGLVAQA